MNARLKTVKDGTGAMDSQTIVWFRVAQIGGTRPTRHAQGEIYWPFALVFYVSSSSDDDYTISHLPSGHDVTNIGIPRRKAIALVQKLRALGDWTFTKPKGAKFDAIKTGAKKLVRRYRRPVSQ